MRVRVRERERERKRKRKRKRERESKLYTHSKVAIVLNKRPLPSTISEADPRQYSITTYVWK